MYRKLRDLEKNMDLNLKNKPNKPYNKNDGLKTMDYLETSQLKETCWGTKATCKQPEKEN